MLSRIQNIRGLNGVSATKLPIHAENFLPSASWAPVENHLGVLDVPESNGSR
jgi:hypothetical protein